MIVNVTAPGAHWDVFVAFGSKWASPFHHFKHSKIAVAFDTRAEAVQAFEQWLMGDAHQDVEPERLLWIIENLPTLKGKVLGDYSAPNPSHAGVLERLANEWAV